ncbi:hypothetical protein QJS66_16905 [Kocuria rhizophila]|nr:hypothetical protein QJS66_16905 [Kocuria rhizophila]
MAPPTRRPGPGGVVRRSSRHAELIREALTRPRTSGTASRPLVLAGRERQGTPPAGAARTSRRMFTPICRRATRNTSPPSHGE